MIFIGKFAFALIWLLMFYNLIFPFPNPANIIINFALLFFVFTRGLQTWLFNKTLTKSEKKPSTLIKIFFFGVFEALNWKK